MMGIFVALSYTNGRNDLNSKNSPYTCNKNPTNVHLTTIKRKPTKKSTLPLILPFLIL